VLESKKKERDAKALFEAKRLYYVNEQSIFASTQTIGIGLVQTESFNLQMLLDYFMDLLSAKAMTKASVLTLITEPSFPKEVTSDRTKLEIILMTIMTYLIEHSDSSDIRVEAKMKSAYKDGYCVSFSFGCSKLDRSSLEALRAVFAAIPEGAAPPPLPASPVQEHDLPLFECKKLVLFLNGTTDATEEDFFKIHIDLTVGHPDALQNGPNAKKLSIYQAEKAGAYTTRWMPKPHLLAEGKGQDPGTIPKSPALRSVGLSEQVTRKLQEGMKQAKTKTNADVIRRKLKPYCGESTSPMPSRMQVLQREFSKLDPKPAAAPADILERQSDKERRYSALGQEEPKNTLLADSNSPPKPDDSQPLAPDPAQAIGDSKNSQQTLFAGPLATATPSGHKRTWRLY
jgi:hypothetical protein